MGYCLHRQPCLPDALQGQCHHLPGGHELGQCTKEEDHDNDISNDTYNVELYDNLEGNLLNHFVTIEAMNMD